MLTSFSTTKNRRWLVGVPESPNDLFNPLDDTWSWMFKVLGGYEFPYGIRTGTFIQVLSGDKLQRTYRFRRNDPDGGPSLPSSSTITLPLEPYGSLSLPTMTVVNLRATKRFRFGRGFSLDVNFDIFNLLNANTATDMDDVSGPTYGQIGEILNPRIAPLFVQSTFDSRKCPLNRDLWLKFVPTDEQVKKEDKRRGTWCPPPFPIERKSAQDSAYFR
jgi:hypothetical protein